MKFDEFKNKSVTELKELLAEAGALVRDLRFQAHERQLKNPRALRQQKKRVAQIQTQLSAHERSVKPQTTADEYTV